MELFAHLPQFDRGALHASLQRLGLSNPALHPAVTQLGLRLADGTASGGAARCVALLRALRQVVADYSLPPGRTVSRDLRDRLGVMIQFLVACRPLSVSMGNAIRFLKDQARRRPDPCDLCTRPALSFLPRPLTPPPLLLRSPT